MNDTIKIEQRPEVGQFVRAVRARLTDLSEEEREELVGGLDADMGDLVADRGVHALPDPAEYAAELRSAAGFTAVAATSRRGPRDLRDRTMAWLDRRAVAWDRWVDTGDHLGLPEFAHALLPVWWVVRALCATALVTELFMDQGIFGFTLDRALVALVAIVLSVQLGRGAWRVGELIRRSLTARLVLVALNVLAIVVLPLMLNRFLVAQTWAYADDSYYDPSGEALTFQGNPVSNIYAYDSQGHPLVGVQLVDQDGRRLPLEPSQYDDSTGKQLLLQPWLNGRTELYSVFPLPEQATDESTGEPVGEPAMQPPPFASLPPVTLAGVQPSVLLPPTVVEAQRRAALEKAARVKAEARKQALRDERERQKGVGNGG